MLIPLPLPATSIFLKGGHWNKTLKFKGKKRHVRWAAADSKATLWFCSLLPGTCNVSLESPFMPCLFGSHSLLRQAGEPENKTHHQAIPDYFYKNNIFSRIFNHVGPGILCWFSFKLETDPPQKVYRELHWFWDSVFSYRSVSSKKDAWAQAVGNNRRRTMQWGWRWLWEGQEFK